MKSDKVFTSSKTRTILQIGRQGVWGVCIRIWDDKLGVRVHTFNNKKEVKRLIKQLKKSLNKL